MRNSTSRTTLVAVSAASALALAACGGSAKKEAAASPTPTPSVSASTAAPAPPPATCPLTGKVPTKTMKRTRPPLALKIDNVNDARPQTGVQQADVVFEETVEGGVTRLFAIFQCERADVVGPVRSARTTDSSLIQLLGRTIFGYSGANSRVNAVIHGTRGAVPLSYDENGGLFYRGGTHVAPHNVYTSTTRLVTAGVGRSKNLKAPRPLFTYSKATPAAKVVHSIDLRWSPLASAGWSWRNNHWVRTQNGTPDVLTTGRQLATDNVIVMRIKTRYLGLHDVLGSASPDDVITGHGKVWVFRNGRVVRGHWFRKTLSSPLLLVAHGKRIPLAPGKTWVELLPQPGTLSFSRQ